MSENGLRFRPMLIGEVAKVAGDPRETIRTRDKQGVYGFQRATGWKRYTDFETVIIAIHSQLKRATQDDDLAKLGFLLAGKTLMDEWREDEKGIPYFQLETFRRDRFLIFWRDAEGKWTGELADAPGDAEAATNKRIAESYGDAPAFTVVNFGALLKRTLVRIIEVQIETEPKAEGEA